jgi:enoyl-CoA hydratase
MANIVRLERDGAVASIVLSNPPLNLFTDDAFEQLLAAFGEVEESDARALVWRADGEIFTGGVEVSAFQRVLDSGGEEADRFAQPLIDAVRRLEAIEIPSIALVHGVCLTAGLEIALGCDIIWATESASRRWSGSPPAPGARSGWPSGRAPPGRGSS